VGYVYKINIMICNKCKVDKDESEFCFRDKKLKILNHICKECQKEYKLKYYYKNKDSHYKRNKITNEKLDKYILEYKLSHPCSICGESCPECLDFHHLFNKRIEVARAKRLGSLLKLKEEVSKCIVLCANCHRKVHAGIIKLGG
jgi:hypothetical protein